MNTIRGPTCTTTGHATTIPRRHSSSSKTQLGLHRGPNPYEYAGNDASNATDLAGRWVGCSNPTLATGGTTTAPKCRSIREPQWAESSVLGVPRATSGVVEVARNSIENIQIGIGGAPFTDGKGLLLVGWGVVNIAHGLDTTQAGITQMVTGEYEQTYTAWGISSALEHFGVSHQNAVIGAEVADTALNIAGTWGYSSPVRDPASFSPVISGSGTLSLASAVVTAGQVSTGLRIVAAGSAMDANPNPNNGPYKEPGRRDRSGFLSSGVGRKLKSRLDKDVDIVNGKIQPTKGCLSTRMRQTSNSSEEPIGSRVSRQN